jgi:ATP-binding cassette subfamily F protein 3
MDRLAPPDSAFERDFNLKLPRGRRGPDVVVELRDVFKSYGDVEVFRGLDLTVLRGERLALIGPNGRGKSTLVKIMAGLTPIDSGFRKVGQSVDLGYFSQFQMDGLNPDLNLVDELAKAAGHLTPGSLRTILGGFLFSGDDALKKVAVLSGGEKTRLVLAKIMMKAPNFLIMDEPTNHLDIPGRQLLEDALDDYEGTMVLISHDRHFINRLCDKVGVIEDGRLVVHHGNYDDYRNVWLKGAEETGQKAPSPPSAYVASTGGRAADATAGRRDVSSARQVDRQGAAEARKREASRRRPLETLIKRAEERLEAIRDEIADVETALCDPSVYQVGEKVKELSRRLAELKDEKVRLEAAWETAMTELGG